MIKRRTGKIQLSARLDSGPDKPGSEEWRRDAEALWDYMHRNMRDSLELRSRLYPKNATRHLPRYVPFVWRVVREKTPQRIDRDFLGLDGERLPEATVELIRSFYAEAGLDAALRAARKQLVALSQSTVWIWPTQGGRSVRAFTVPIHRQSVDMGHPLSAQVDDVAAWHLEVPVGGDKYTEAIETAVARITPHRQEWVEALDQQTGEPVWPYAGEDVPNKNALGMIPVAMMRAEEPEPGYWWGEVPRDLLYAQRALNMDLTTTGVVADMQGFSQAVSKGLTAAQAKELEVGPESVVGLPGLDYDFGFASPNADLAQRVATSNQYMQAVISAQGLSPQTFLKSSGITATAKRVENQARDAERRWDMPTIQEAEQRCYDILRGWLRVLRGVEVLPPAVVQIAARDVVEVVDPLHDAQALQLAIFAGQTDEVAARAEREGVSREEAKRRVDESLRVSAELAAERRRLGLSDTPTAGASSQTEPVQAGDEINRGPGRPPREIGELS